MFTKDDTIKVQTALNLKRVSKIAVDGDFGPETRAALFACLGIAGTPQPVPVPTPVPTPQPNVPSDKSWRQWFLDRFGWTEFNHDKELAKGWPLVGLPQYNTVIGTAHAWCGMSLATALNANGYKIPKGAAAAADWDGYGTPINWKKVGIPQGAVVRIRHADGNGHVTTADRDHKPGEAILDALGGNQGNSINVTRFIVDGNNKGHNQIMWVGWPVKG